MKPSPLVVGSAALLLSLAPAGAQEHPAAGVPLVRVPIHTATDDLGLAYGTWAAGAHYKASFHDGMTFVPYLGADYPHNQPLSWRTVAATVGDVSLQTGDAPRGVRVSDWRYEYHHGGVVEAYDVRAEGLEQTFVVARLPARGDLVVTGRLTSQMHAANVEASHAALTFCDDAGRELVRYGEAFAIDADGAKVAIPTRHHDGEVTLRVPADWLATARLPVTIDPLLAPVTVSTILGPYGEIHDVDIVTATRNAIVYSRSSSATDRDCFGLRTDADFSNVHAIWSDITTSWCADQPCCALSNTSHKYVFAWRRLFEQLSPTRSLLRIHQHGQYDTSLGTGYHVVSTPNGYNDWRPDLGGCPYLQTAGSPPVTSDRFLLVCQREHNNTADFANTRSSDIAMTWFQVLQTGTPTFEHTEVVRGDNTYDYERPNVRQEGSNRLWPIVWQRYPTLQLFGDWDVRGALYGVDNQTQDQPYEMSTLTPPQQAAGHHQTGPRVAGSVEYMVTFMESAAGFTGKVPDIAGESLEVRMFDIDLGYSPLSANVYWGAANTLRTSSTRSWEITGLENDLVHGSHFAVGFRSVGALPSAYFARLGGDAGIVEGDTDGDALLHVAFGELPSPVAVSFDSVGDSWRIAYGLDGAYGQPLRGHVLEQPSAPPPLASGYGCAPGTLEWRRLQLSGTTDSYVRADSNMTPAPFHLLQVSTSLVDVGVLHPLVAPGCRLLVDTFGPGYVGAIVSGPAYTFLAPFPLPSWLPSMDLYFQDWLFDGNELTSTHRLTVPIRR